MTEKEAYIEGFKKAAESAGISQNVIEKLAKDSTLSNLADTIVSGYKSLDPSIKRSLLIGLLGGAGTFALSDGTADRRLTKSLLAGGTLGAGAYALDRSGLWNAGVNKLTDKIKDLRA